jgi:SecY
MNQPPIIRLVLVTLAAFAAYRLGSKIPLPGVDVTQFVLHGVGALDRVSLFALGLWPWLSALTVIELAVLLLPATVIARLGLTGSNTPFSGLVIALALLFAAMQGYGIAVALTHVSKLVSNPSTTFLIGTTASLCAGTALVMTLARIIERQGVGDGFWVMLAGSMLASVPGQALQLFATVAQGAASLSAVAATLAFDVAIIAAVVALVLARRQAGLNNAEPVIWPVILAPLAASWLVTLLVVLWPGNEATQPAAIDFFLINSSVGLILHAVIVCALVACYAFREGQLGFALPTAALAIGVALISKFALTGLQLMPLLIGPSAVVVAAVCTVIGLRLRELIETQKPHAERAS